MHEFASFNHEILPVSEINISALSNAGLYGGGVFTTLAIYGSEPFLWEKHWRRLNENAGRLGIGLSGLTEEKVLRSLEELLEKNLCPNGRCRITVFDESAAKIWPGGTGEKTSLLIQTADRREPGQNISLTLSSYGLNSASPLAGIKSCNYLENICALNDDRSKGFDEAIRLNERGEIASACLANVFWLRDEKLFTPELQTGCLAGTTREFVLENREVFETAAKPDVLSEADAVFLTSAGIGIVRAGSFGERRFGAGQDDLTQLIPDV